MRACTACRSASLCFSPLQFPIPIRLLPPTQVRSSCFSPQNSVPPRPLHKRPLSTRAYPPSAVPFHQPRQASSVWSIVFLACLVSGAAAVQVIYSSKASKASNAERQSEPPKDWSQDYLGEIDTLKMSSDAIPPGHVGNLTEEQEAKLREMWVVLLKLFGVKFEEGSEVAGDNESVKNENATQDKKKSRRSFFGLRSSDSGKSVNGTTSNLSSLQISDGDDKYGQTKEFQQALAAKTPEELRETFWSMVKQDDPDALLLRFLRARKWDVNKAVVMLISTIRWRADEMHVDDDIMFGGEAAALEQSKSSDPSVRRLGEDFLAQFRMGKSFIHGVDKLGRPMCLIRVRLHKIGAQSEKSIERYTVHMIETARAMLPRPVETAVIIFDMTNFTLANMDYTPVKFIIKCFEANYPESLGAVLIHQAPWIFSGIWKIIKGWLDPVVAAKVHFTNSVEDLEQFIPRDRILKELGGDDDYEYQYVEPQPNENDAMKDTAKRDQVIAKAKQYYKELQDATQSWVVAASKGDKEEVDSLKAKRAELIEKTGKTYWEMDPYIRARSFYDRTGVLKGDGSVVFYPEREEKKNKKEEVIVESEHPAEEKKENGLNGNNEGEAEKKAEVSVESKPEEKTNGNAAVTAS
ncbi:hypothetical protein VTN96DRAFT_10063 [Rasamsonia emersonii]